MISIFLRAPFLFMASVLFSSSVFANELFTVELIINPNTIPEARTFSLSNAEDAIRQFGNDQFDSYFPTYTESTPVMAKINFRGLPINLDSSGTAVTLDIASLSIKKTFNGPTRDDSLDQLVNFSNLREVLCSTKFRKSWLQSPRSIQ
jgi:hypothetical protein